jgi:hypothetical protein
MHNSLALCKLQEGLGNIQRRMTNANSMFQLLFNASNPQRQTKSKGDPCKNQKNTTTYTKFKPST